MERKDLYLFAGKIFAIPKDIRKFKLSDDNVRPQVHEALADELRTIQSETQWMSSPPMEKGRSVSAVGPYPISKGCGFYAYDYKSNPSDILAISNPVVFSPTSRPLLFDMAQRPMLNDPVFAVDCDTYLKIPRSLSSSPSVAILLATS